ncbi:MerR family transcriptional regulator [Thiomicrorhabdus cannonii]|uniref:MerR family transcriptional regulator n=1 Tax=Thiomicrorhabdus cannonii TaxID=2748011 RepID=UPI0015BF324D|nr:MerR family transcriptional regulator [Thiomicrorhabdus cannonii]
MNQSEALYPIREVSRLTGVNPITLRAWERRYGLFEPVRTPSGHRLFTQQVVERIQRAVALTEKGIPISQVKQFLNDAPASVPSPVVATAKEETDFAAALLAALDEADVSALQGLFDRLWTEWPESLCRRLLVEASQAVNGRDAARRVLWSSVLRPRLMTRLYHACRALNEPPRIWLSGASVGWSPEMSEVLCALAALRLADLGVYPLWGGQAFVDKEDDQPMLAALKTLKCEGVALVGDGSDADHWLAWHQRHASLGLYYFAVGIEPQETLQALNTQLGVHCEGWQAL